MMKTSVFKFLNSLGLDRLSRSQNRGRPVILTFHGVTAEAPGGFCNYQGKHLHLPIFTRLMEHLAEHYQTVPLARVVGGLYGGAALPERAAVVTFDDGYRNVLTEAAPVLSRLDIPATVFMVTDFVTQDRMLWTDRLISALALTEKEELLFELGGRTYEYSIRDEGEKKEADRAVRKIRKALSDEAGRDFIDQVIDRLGASESALADAWPCHQPLELGELKQLAAYGITAGSHTCSHPSLARCSIEDMKHELEESKKIIQESTGVPCDEFAYPNGSPADFSDVTRRQVMAAGYRSAVTTVSRRVVAGQDPFEIPRYINANNDTPAAEFAAEASGYPTALRTLRNRLAGRR